MWLPLFQKKQMKFLTSRISLGILVTLRKAEVRASRLATSVVWPYMSTFPWEDYVCGLDVSGPPLFFSKIKK